MSSPMRLSRRTLTLSVGLALLTVLTCLVAFLPVPYVTMRPGPVFNTLGDLDGRPMLTFGKGVRTYPTDGRLDFTTVSVTRAESRMSLSGAIEGWLDPDVAVVPHDFVYPDRQTNEESRAEGAAELASSQDASRAAALKAAGLTVVELPKVAQVVEGGPAEGKLQAGDLILTVDGRKVADQEAVGKAISARKPGAEVTIGYRRDGKDGTATITTTEMPDDPEKARVGISVGTGFEFPIEIENHIGDRVGGPSAGAMFALAIYDELTPGALTGGQNVAGTGTIDPDGKVGAIGGVRQKMAGAAKAGADIFLVPAQNCQEATAGGDFDMTLVKVEKLQDAIDAVSALAKNPNAKVSSCE
ncbi:PDZ domain-containing protein [Aeromicrobium senzhongii]|uniref:endopeptidase La n=1 Tax=Aeromicrobium senzhongii TaxID=2663859 RepID=A0ABX6SRJ3_9ACTN|nr:PDZ domain-containing protein [Aeromicrobium senzhongii]MTB89000.1 PDZ domain-containing protein [Aeromicrobium senzhongii]QNL93722.1 PDZ domain-containing protein [Aeromicrobium senzhongii]